MPPQGLRLTALFVVVWMLPVFFALLMSLSTVDASPSVRRTIRIGLRVLIVGYVFAAVALLLWPFRFDLSVVRIIRHGNFTPLRGSLRFLVTDAPERPYFRHDFLHVVLLIPVGLLLPLQQRWKQRLWVVAGSAILVVLLTVVLEVAQGVTVVGRGFDVDDAIAGAAGALAAVGVGALLRLVVDRWPTTKAAS